MKYEKQALGNTWNTIRDIFSYWPALQMTNIALHYVQCFVNFQEEKVHFVVNPELHIVSFYASQELLGSLLLFILS